jgi:hypothetical protein
LPTDPRSDLRRNRFRSRHRSSANGCNPSGSAGSISMPDSLGADPCKENAVTA